MESTLHPEYRFGRFRLLPEQRQLLDADASVKLGSRAFDILVALVEQRDRPIPKRELMDRVWPKLVVEENNLQVQIVALRKILGSDAIATIPGRGYRFTVPVEVANPMAERPRPSLSAEGPQGTSRDSNVQSRAPTLYGRDNDIAAVRALLEQRALVSIVGAGGIGKTRLAQVIAEVLRDQFADGVYMVELAAVNDPGLVAGEVARPLGIQLSTQRPAVEVIGAALALQSTLVVLDNCEHLLGSVAPVAHAMSRAGPGVRVLVTSQEPLKIGDEHVFRLDPLAVPAEQDFKDAQDFGAIQMFVARAQAVDPQFELIEDNRAAVIEVCRRLDGIPLALELAAARLPLLGIEGLRSRLDERFHVLTGGSRFALRRHQTLRAALDFSHGLLSPAEQAVFRRLGTFAGSFALESAQRVCADDSIDAWNVLDCLSGLVDKSMVVARGDKFSRLQLLETTRAYALEKLADAGETTNLLQRHARATAMRMTHVYDDCWRLPEKDWLGLYAFELDNLRAALAWALRNDSELAIALVGDSLELWKELALQPEALKFCEAALALVRADTPARAAGRLWYALAMIVANTWISRSRDAAARAIALLRDADDPGVLALALTRLAGSSRGKPTQQQLDAVAELARMHDPEWPPRLQFVAELASAFVHRGAMRLPEARRSYQKALDFAASCGAVSSEMGAQVNVADVALMMGDIDYAIQAYRDMSRRLASHHDRLFYIFALAGLSTALLFRQQVPAAREALTTAVPLILRYDLAFRYADSVALLCALEGRTETAARMLGYGEAAGRAHGEDQRDRNEATARNKVLERLAATENPANVERWMREGALLTDAEAYRQALAPTPSADAPQ
jgi:predicted ATPase/DNA-binding winged helix-turn-helix (wHTH) protein